MCLFDTIPGAGSRSIITSIAIYIQNDFELRYSLEDVSPTRLKSIILILLNLVTMRIHNKKCPSDEVMFWFPLYIV